MDEKYREKTSSVATGVSIIAAILFFLVANVMATPMWVKLVATLIFAWVVYVFVTAIRNA